MSIPVQSVPPDSRTPYVIPQLEGERMSIPGSKGVFRLLASSKQTNGGMAVFTSGSGVADAPGFHWHQEAHDVFLVTKGFLKLWNHDKCRIMGPGDFAYVPPTIIHNPETLGPHYESLGLVAPGDWVDFFRYVGEPYDGPLCPETDERDIKAALMSKLMAAKDRFDVHFARDYAPPELGDWLESENHLPGPLQPYFLRANTGPRWMAGGVMSRPFILADQCSGKFAISSIESSRLYNQDMFRRYLAFQTIDHCLYIMEGTLRVKLQGREGWNEVHEGETVVISAGQGFKLKFASRFVRAVSFANGKGLDELCIKAGTPCKTVMLPDVVDPLDEATFKAACAELHVTASIADVR